MVLSLLVLDGSLKGSFIPLKKGYVFKQFNFDDSSMAEQHAYIDIDYNFAWNIKCLDGNKIRLSSAEKPHISLLPDLIFHIGQTGFKVVQNSVENSRSWSDLTAELLSKNEWVDKPSRALIFLNPLQIEFIQGPQTNETLTLAYGPRMMGYNNIDLRLKDPTLPKNVFSFEQHAEHVLIKNLSKDSSIHILLNQKNFEHAIIQNGDILAVGSTIMTLNYFKG